MVGNHTQCNQPSMGLPCKLTNLIKKFRPFLQLREVLTLNLQKAVGRLCAHTKFATHSCLSFWIFGMSCSLKLLDILRQQGQPDTRVWGISDWEHTCMDLQRPGTNSQPNAHCLTVHKHRDTAWMSSS